MNYILIAEELEAKNIKIPKKLENNTKIIITGFGEYHALRTIIKLFEKNVFFLIYYLYSMFCPL